MAADTHFDLEELDDDPVPEIVVEEFKPERKPFNFRPVLIGLGVLLAGGGLGGLAYVLTAYETRDLIGLMDVGENPPKLSFDLPGRGDPAKPGAGGGLLTPPVAPGAEKPAGETPPALPDDAPSPDSLPPAIAPDKAVPPAVAEARPESAVAALPPGDYVAEPESPVSKAFAPKPPPPVDSSGMPTQPNPRNADKPPSYEGLPALKGEVKALPAAPVKDLLKKTAIGDVPAPAPDGRQPWQVYARPWSGPADRGKVAVVVMDMGLDKAATEAAIAKLPPEVTLAFSPYAQSLDKWVKKARDHGHEVMMVLPADAAGAQPRDPGPLGMTNAVPPETNLARIEGVMARAAGYTGLISLGDKFAATEQIVQTLGKLRDHGLLYVGPGAAPADRIPAIAPVTAVADSDLFREAIDMRLNQVSITARTKGKALVVINPRPLSFDRLLPWLNDFDGQKLVIVPVSTLVQPRPPPESHEQEEQAPLLPYDQRPYRPGVGLVLLDPRGLAFVAQRIDTPGDSWQFPQGGIDEGEDPRATALREMEEEIGTNKAEIIAESRGWISYDLPPDIADRSWKGRFRGQTQKWFCARFTGDDSDIDLDTEHPEFARWRWMALDEVPGLIIPFKRALYDRVVAEFLPVARSIAAG